MGAYISVPFVAKKTVACEPAIKQDSTEQVMEVVKTEVKTEVKVETNTERKEIVQETVKQLAPIQEVVPVVEEKKEIVPVKEEKEEKEEEKKEEKEEEKKEEKKEEEKKEEVKMSDQTLKECMEIEAMMAKVSVTDLKIKIPEEEVAENVVVTRAPEFRNQSQPESHAVKKFNKKHRKN